MLAYELNRAEGILILKPKGPLEKTDFENLAREVDPYIVEKGMLNGLMIYTESFPGWENFAAFLSHMTFVRNHHRKIKKIAAVTGSGFLSIMPKVARHFTGAEIRHYDFEKKETALNWLKAWAGRRSGQDPAKGSGARGRRGLMTEEIRQLNDVWISAWFEKDAATVDDLMTPDYEYVAPNGQVLDRATILRIIRSPTYALASGSRTEVKLVGIAPDVFVVSFRWQGTGTFEGRSFTDDHRGTMLCVRRNEKWRVAHEQCSPIRP